MPMARRWAAAPVAFAVELVPAGEAEEFAYRRAVEFYLGGCDEPFC
jgi:hypothetical protein